MGSPGPRQAEVTDLEVAVGVEQQVGGLQVAVQHVGGVDVLQAPQQLQGAARAHVQLQVLVPGLATT